MSFTGVKNLDHSIDKTNAWLAEIAAEFGTEDRQFAYRVTRAWLHALRDRLPDQVAANFAAQLPELLRGVFYGGWSPSRVPVKFGPREYVLRFARDAGIHDTDVPRAARLVTRAVGRPRDGRGGREGGAGQHCDGGCERASAKRSVRRRWLA